MTYAALSDLVNQFGSREVIQLTDRNNTGAADPVVAAAALQRATDTIDAYLAARYQLPLTVVPDQLVDICCDIARYKLCGAEVTETEEIRNRFKDALKMLEHIRDNKVDIGLTLAGAAPVENQSVQVAATARVFSSNLLADY